MPRATVRVASFNAGYWDRTVSGRVDHEKYPASLRQCENFILTPQGPVVRRSGTKVMGAVRDETTYSRMVPFVYSLEQMLMLEFSAGRVRFFTNDGLLTYTSVAVTAVLSTVGAPLRLNALGHGCAVGDQVALVDFDVTMPLNSSVGNVIAVAGSIITLNLTHPAVMGSTAAARVARVYHVASPYTLNLPSLRFVPSLDTLFIFSGERVRTLKRYGTYDWRFAEAPFKDGPFLAINQTSTRLAPSDTGAPTPSVMTADVEGVGYEADKAFDNDPATYWETTGTAQHGVLTAEFAAGVVIDGYSIQIPGAASDPDFDAIDYAPSSWTLAGSTDGITYETLDTQRDYVLYESSRSVFFSIANATAFTFYRLSVTRCRRNGNIPVRIARLSLAARSTSEIHIVASAVTGINGDAGFTAGDIGRQLRLKCTDQAWRALTFTGYVSATEMIGELQGEALPDTEDTGEWRLGPWSDGLGWPKTGCFYEDRLVMAGATSYPDTFGITTPGGYGPNGTLTMSPTDVFGVQLDGSGMCLTLNSRSLAQIAWCVPDDKGILLGAGAQEHSLASADPNTPLTAKTAKARPITSRGSSSVEPVKIGRQTIFVQRSERKLHEIAYSFNVDGYVAASLSLFAAELASAGIDRIEYAPEPHSIVWCRSKDGRVLALTYNKEESVVGWHEHAFDGVVLDIAVLPTADGAQTALWVEVARNIGGRSRIFIERLEPTWVAGDTLDAAHFVDCGVRYTGAATDTIDGLHIHEGGVVSGLADGAPFYNKTVTAGRITLDEPATNVVAGVGYRSRMQTQRIEAGSGDGTAQGKTKRVHEVVVRVADTGGGYVGRLNMDSGEYDLDEISSTGRGPNDTTAALPLFSGDTSRIAFPPGYDGDGSIVIEQPPHLALPLTAIAVFAKLHTND